VTSEQLSLWLNSSFAYFRRMHSKAKVWGQQEAVVCTAYQLCNLNLWHWLGIGNRYCKYKGNHRYTEMILLLLLTSFFPLLLFAMNHKLRTSVVLFCFRCPTVIQSVQECLLCSAEFALISPRNCKHQLCLSFLWTLTNSILNFLNLSLDYNNRNSNNQLH